MEVEVGWGGGAVWLYRMSNTDSTAELGGGYVFITFMFGVSSIMSALLDTGATR